jgi:hypothetical protein
MPLTLGTPSDIARCESPENWPLTSQRPDRYKPVTFRTRGGCSRKPKQLRAPTISAPVKRTQPKLSGDAVSTRGGRSGICGRRVGTVSPQHSAGRHRVAAAVRLVGTAPPQRCHPFAASSPQHSPPADTAPPQSTSTRRGPSPPFRQRSHTRLYIPPVVSMFYQRSKGACARSTPPNQGIPA